MRSSSTEIEMEGGDKALAQLAGQYARRGLDVYSDYGVGSVIQANIHDPDIHDLKHKHMYRHYYAAFNMNLSGFQTKIHAEQLALFQLMLDVEVSGLSGAVELEKVVVATDNDDFALDCGHCFQVIAGACEHYDWDKSGIDYIAAAYQGSEEQPENFHLADWELEKYKFSDLIHGSYTEKT